MLYLNILSENLNDLNLVCQVFFAQKRIDGNIYLIFHIQAQYINVIIFSSPLQATTGWEMPTQTPVTVKSPLAPVSSVTPLSTWPKKKEDSVIPEESENPTSGDHDWSEEQPPILTSTAWGRNTF